MAKLQCVKCKTPLEPEVFSCPKCGTPNYSLRYQGEQGEWKVVKSLNPSLPTLVIDKSYRGLPITKISKGAFLGFSSLSSVTLPNGLITIEDEAFMGCDSLSEIFIPSTVKELGKRAFADCASLAKITFGIMLQTMDSSNVCYCMTLSARRYSTGLSSLSTAPVTCTCGAMKMKTSFSDVPEEAFVNCSSLTEIKIEEGIKKISKNAFQGCVNLETVTLPTSLTELEEPFLDCPKLEIVIFKGGKREYASIKGGLGRAVMVRCNDGVLVG